MISMVNLLPISMLSFPINIHSRPALLSRYIFSDFTSNVKTPFPSLFLIMLQDWSKRVSTSCGRFDPSGGIWQSSVHIPSSGLSYSPDSAMCNGLLSGLPNTLLCRLDSVVRAAAWLIRFNSSTETMAGNWCVINFRLNAVSRIRFKLCELAFQCQNGATPSWTRQLLHKSRQRHRSIVSTVCCFRWLSRSCVFHSDSRSTWICTVSCPASWNLNSLPTFWYMEWVWRLSRIRRNWKL